MDYEKLSKYALVLKNERDSLRKQIDYTNESLNALKNRLKLNMEYEEILRRFHANIFDAVITGKEEVILFIKLYSQNVKWKNLQESQAVMNNVLKSAGIKKLNVETKSQYRIRNPQKIIPPGEYDTVISFPIDL